MKPASGLAALRPILLGSLAFGILGFVLPIYGKQLGASALEIGGLFGRAPLMAVGLAGFALVSLLIPGLPSLAWLIVLWVLEALGWAMAAPAEEAMVADVTGNNTRGTGYGLYYLAASLGATFGPLIGGWLYDAAGHAAPFYLNGILLLAGAVAVLVLLRGKSQTALSTTIGQLP